MEYLTIKTLHVSCVGLSVVLFVLRGGLSLLDKPWRQWRWLRWGPHGVDTLLLASAIGLVVWSGQYPFVQSWLTAKVLALLAYIGLGRQALAATTSKRKRPLYFGLALLSVSYIVGAALTHSATLGLAS